MVPGSNPGGPTNPTLKGMLGNYLKLQDFAFSEVRRN
ncbi:hypothetical protein SBA7_320004 [Candidatus Sulfotelmatobacter sp. SbA7]|nr:hypothetical protein SBA7_320004 [Candidatus Sulfotelmatobacter sp. SbA7]